MATLVVFVQDTPVEDAEQHLLDQEAELRRGIASDSAVRQHDIRRVVPPSRQQDGIG